jgi:hypothetical protein
MNDVMERKALSFGCGDLYMRILDLIMVKVFLFQIIRDNVNKT